MNGAFYASQERTPTESGAPGDEVALDLKTEIYAQDPTRPPPVEVPATM